MFVCCTWEHIPETVLIHGCILYVWTYTGLVDFKYHYLQSSYITKVDILTFTLHRMDNNSLQAGMRFSSSSNLSLCFSSWHHQQGKGGHKTASIWPGNWLRIWPSRGCMRRRGTWSSREETLAKRKGLGLEAFGGCLTLLSIQLLIKNMGGVTRESISCTDRL